MLVEAMNLWFKEKKQAGDEAPVMALPDFDECYTAKGQKGAAEKPVPE